MVSYINMVLIEYFYFILQHSWLWTTLGIF